MEEFDFEQYITEMQVWATEMFLTQAAFIQIGFIVFALFAGYITMKIIRPGLVEKIEGGRFPLRFRTMLANTTKLIMPFTALILLFLFAQVAVAEVFNMHVTMVTVAIKLLFAWIVIRLCLQFIENNITRHFFATSIWIIAALSIMGVLGETTAALDAFGLSIGDFRISALVVLKAILALFVLLYIAIIGSSFAERRILEIKGISRSSQVLIAKIVRVSLIVVALLIGVSSAGIDLSVLALFSGGIGLGIGFGLQKVISNLLSGMMLLVDKSIKPGDVIELETGAFGWVDHMGARYTEITTRDRKSFLIPNEDFITQKVINWSHNTSLIRLETSFGVDYSHNPHEVKRIAEEAAVKPDRVVKEPAPVCHLVEFGDSSMNFKLRFWIEDAEKGVTNMLGAVMLSIWDAFQENNIKIPYPHREVYIHKDESTKD